MNIVFLCGSLESGRDGVGDYVRRLAVEILRQGHKAAAVALNDKHSVVLFDGTQASEGMDLPVLRLPCSLPATQRFNEARSWIDTINPDWISLQFVIFSFHPKGLPFNISKLMKSLGADRHWHIMFHELWVGMNAESSRKQTLWGTLQRLIVKSLLTTIRPEAINTQTALYKEKLAKLGYSAIGLPLFSNVPVKRIVVNEDDQPETSTPIVNLVVFGTIHEGAPIQQLAEEIKVYSSETNVNFILTFIGRCGPELDKWVMAWTSMQLECHVLGEQSPDEITIILSNSDAGISTTPISLVEKSGTVAAMREHGLPVLCVSREWTPRAIDKLPVPEGIWKYEKGVLDRFFETEKAQPINDQLSKVASQLLNELKPNIQLVNVIL